MTDLMPIFSRVVGVLLVMVVGAVARRLGWLTRDADSSLARLTAYVLLPALFVDRILGGESFASLLVAWVPPAIGFLTTVIGMLLGFALSRRIGPLIGLADDAAQRAFALAVGVCNYGYIPLPLAQYFFPEAEVSLILHNVGVDLALWTVGIWLIVGGRQPGQRRSPLSPPIAAILVAITLKQLGLAPAIPAAALQAVGALAQCAIPVGLLLSGSILIDHIGAAAWRQGLRTIVAACSFRLLLMPLLMLGTAALLPLTLDVRQVIVLQAAMPSAVFPIVLSRLYGVDTRTAVRVVVSTGLAGVVTIPLWLYAGQLWLLD